MSSAKKHRLSKSKYVTGLQCHKRLWLQVHEPDAPELLVDGAQQAVFDTGHRVGERAQLDFGKGTLIELDPRNIQKAVDETRTALARGADVIFEASFSEDDVFVAVDVLSKEQGGWVVSEVKSTSRVKDQHLPDAAVQAHVVKKAGLPVERLEVMHLNTKHRHPSDGPLFTRADVTKRAAGYRKDVAANIQAQLAALAGPEPQVDPGNHCTSPYECPFITRCCETPPEHSVSDLHRVGKKKLAALEDEGIETIGEIPSDFPLNDLHQRHRRAIKTGDVIVEGGLAKALAKFEYPIAMLDFETIGATLPIWQGTKPFQAIAAQFSVHTLYEDGSIDHNAFLAESGRDPRRSVAEALVPALAHAKTILAWNAGFERRCLKDLASVSPDHRAALLQAIGKLHDLLPVVKQHVYHPGFHGSFSIKSVVPALLPELAYDNLDVSDGGTASNVLEVLLTRPEDIPQHGHTVWRERLLAYCNHDTLVMVALWKLLNQLAAERQVSS